MEESKKDEAWMKVAEEALLYIGLTVIPSQYSHIWTATNGAKAWKALANVYEKNSHATQISLKRQFYSFHHDTSAPIQEYISGITPLATCIKTIRITLTPNDITDVLIFDLNESYSSIAISLTAAKGELTVANMTSAIINEEGRRLGLSDQVQVKDSELKEENVTYYAHSQKSIKCFNCGKMGHMVRNCHAPKKDEANVAFTPMDDENDNNSDGVW